ncbi:hypothetical protein E5288_WYG011551 [Bos mutus]|uniref:Uncharacterized protein n=1 Tax=Bos mutus TaxID=72004 RepID=A0A6B0RHX3_9CETA|nr:hypothetical protein [Bos mutus]
MNRVPQEELSGIRLRFFSRLFRVLNDALRSVAEATRHLPQTSSNRTPARDKMDEWIYLTSTWYNDVKVQSVPFKTAEYRCHLIKPESSGIQLWNLDSDFPQTVSLPPGGTGHARHDQTLAKRSRVALDLVQRSMLMAFLIQCRISFGVKPGIAVLTAAVTGGFGQLMRLHWYRRVQPAQHSVLMMSIDKVIGFQMNVYPGMGSKWQI